MHGLCFVCFRSALERLKVKDTSEVPLPFLLEQAFLFQAAKLQKPFHLIPLVAVSAHPDIEHLSTSDFSVPVIPNSQNCANALSASGVDADKSAQHKGPAVRSPGQILMSIGTLSVFKSASERFEPLNLLCLVRLGKIIEDFPLTVPIDVQEAQNKKPVTAVC